MQKYFRRRIPLVGAALVMMTLNAGGCSSAPKTPPKPPVNSVLKLKHHLGGTHYRTLVRGGVWYQTFGGALLVIDPAQSATLSEIPFGKPGEIGPAVDMVIDDAQHRMVVVIEDDEVIQLSLIDPRAPVIVSRTSAGTLGIRPRRLSVVDGDIFASGPGGVVRLSDSARMLKSDEDVGRVGRSRDGLVASVGRQIHRLPDDRYAGAASDVQMMPLSLGDPNTLMFTLQSEQGALVGLMNRDLRETQLPRGHIAVKGQVRRVREAGGKLWIVDDQGVTGYAVDDSGLTEAVHVAVLGARDVDLIDSNYLAIAGAFGRTVYRIEKDQQGPGSVFVRGQREASGLEGAACDGQHILAGGSLGLWMYLINARVELTTRLFDKQPPSPRRAATTVFAEARISQDGRSIEATPAPAHASDTAPWTYSEPDGSLIHTVVAVDGDFWIGHDKGITVLRAADLTAPPQKSTANKSGSSSATPPLDRVRARLRLEGPVLYLFPLLVGNGASYVSQLGGFGVAEFVDEPVLVPAGKPR